MAGGNRPGGRLLRFGIMLATVVTAAALGLTSRTASANHYSRSSAVCETRASAITCTLTIGPLQGDIFSNEPISVVLTDGLLLDADALLLVSAEPSPCAASIPAASVGHASFIVRVGVAGCLAGSTITIAERLTPTAAGGGPLTQTVSSPLFESATVTATTAGGAIFQIPDMLAGSLKICSSAGSAISCTLTIGPLIALPAGETITVTLAGDGGPGTPAAAAFVTDEVRREGGGCATTDPAGVTADTFFLTTTDTCAGFDVIVIAETLTVTGTGGGPLCQAIAHGAATPVVVCATTPDGQPFAVPGPGEAPDSITAACAAAPPAPPDTYAVRVGGQLACVLTIAPAGGIRPGVATVTLADAAFDAAGTTTKDFPCGDAAAGVPCTTFMTMFSPTAACVVPRQTITLGGATFSPAVAGPHGEAISVLPASGDCSAPAPPISMRAVCAPSGPAGVRDPATQVRPGQTVGCTVTATFARPSAGGAANVALTNAVFSGGAAAAAFTCTPPGPGGTALADTCSFAETFTPTVSCAAPAQTVTLLGVVFTPAIVTESGDPIEVLAEAGSVCVAPAGRFVQPITPRVTCTSSEAIPKEYRDGDVSPVPGRAGGAVLAGIGMLPETMLCKVDVTLHRREPNIDFPAEAPRFITRRLPVAPGMVDVSSIHGILLDAGGRPATKLRLSCESEVRRDTDPETETIANDPNTCRGAQFAVAGPRLGIFSVRVRYLPSAAAAAAGIRPVEDAADVGFIAPAVAVALTLSDSPVAAGGTGVATATLSVPDPPCAQAMCVDPTTGTPIRVRPGSVLNGTVMLAIDNPRIAAWTAVQPSAAAGMIPEPGRAVIRCGRQAGEPAASIGAYFRGCASVAAAYRAILPGEADVTATFIPDLPGAAGAGVAIDGVPAIIAALTGRTAAPRPNDGDTLTVVDPAGAAGP